MHCAAEAPLGSEVMDSAPSAGSHATIGDEEMQLLSDALRSLPSDAVKDLLSMEVCLPCIFRLFGISGHAYFRFSLPSPVMYSIIGESANLDKHTASCEKEEDSGQSSTRKGLDEICRICLGILQFTYRDTKETVYKQNNLAVSIAEMVKQQGYLIDSFNLEVSLPPIVQENELVVRSYLKRQYQSQSWFQEKISECISTKDALKLAIVSPLETLLDVKSGPSSYRIRLTYTQTKSSNATLGSIERNGVCKRRKADTDELVDASTEYLGFSTTKGNTVYEKSSNGMEEHKSSKCLDFPAKRVNEPCYLVFSCYRAPIYIGGRYLKFSRNVSQTRWIIDDERMGEASVEEIIGCNILPLFKGDMYKFHAAGREDIDVRMLGSGRPFLIEIQNAREVPSEASVKQIETKINNFENKLVGVKNMKVVADSGWTLMHEGESEKQKQYCALVWISRPLEDGDLHSIASFKDMQILQRTPIRVLHRRSPLEREKIIHWMKVERIAGSSQYFLLHLCTQAGTYIKEFVHGDLGRTRPSIGSILGCRAEILQLDVTDVKMECFE